MSVCSDFAEHVWKPGSCKNCFHQQSAHKTVGCPARAAVATACPKSGGDDNDTVTTPSPYSKPTIAVKPTMISLDTGDSMADVNMNIEQNTKSPVERLGLKKMLDLSSLYIDSNNCNKSLRDTTLQSPGTKTDLCFSSLSKDSMIISNMLVTQDEGRKPHNTNGDNSRQQNSTTSPRTKSTYNPSVAAKRANFLHQNSMDKPSLVAIEPTSPAKVYSNGISCGSTTVLIAKTSSTSAISLTSALSVDTVNNSQQSIHSPPVVSKQNSPLDSSSSFGSSTDSLPVTGDSVGSAQSPQATGNSAPSSPSGPDSEPIYAESTKKKRKPQRKGVQSYPGSPDQTNYSEFSGEAQRATITVMAAHTEENNRTFYLSSPDSAISTQCHFSPTAHKDPSSTAFRWPSPSRSAPSLVTEPILAPSLHPSLQSSPPIPPKRTTRSPKLGTSSLSPSISSPVLQDLPRLGTSSLSPSLPSPVPLPEFSRLFLVSAKEGHFKVQPENHSMAASERWQKHQHHHSSAWNCRIDEEEEEEERERKEAEKKTLTTNPWTTSRVTSLVNGAAVWKESRVCNKALSSPPPKTEPGVAPPLLPNNVACQGDSEGAIAVEEAKQSRSMPAKQHDSSTEPMAAGSQGSASHEANQPPPPPPPKKQHRASGHLSGSNMELNRCTQLGSLESPATSPRDLGSARLRTASTDSLTADAGSRDRSWLSCSSPFLRSPVASAPGSPRPPTFSITAIQPPPLPEKKIVNRTVSAPDSATSKAFLQAYPRLLFTGSENNVCRPNDSSCRASLPSSPVDTRPIFSSNESLECCHAPLGRPSRSRTLDEPFKNHGRLGVHCRSSITCSSSPQLSAPFSASEAGPAPNLGSSLQLQTLLSNIDSREGVYSKLGGLYAESLRRLALKCEEHFTGSQRNRRFEESNWSLFRLTSNKPSCNAGDAVYYSAACASDPSNSYAVKICKSPSAEAKQGRLYGLSVQQSMPPHFNLQQDCGHFLACVPQSMLPPDQAASPASSPKPRGQQAERERVVVIVPEIPRQTAADFAREFEAFHKSQPEVYERRVCFLLLQLCHGLEHLKDHGVTHRHLCLENLLLVPYPPAPPPPTQQTEMSEAFSQRHLPRLLISNFAKAKRRTAEDTASASVDPRVKRDHARLAPEIVSAAQYRKFDEFQTGILIYELLHQHNPFEVSPALKEQDYRCEDLPTIPPVSLYSAGLQRLARLLLQPDPIKRIHIQDAKRILQSLLWGPRKDLLDQQWEKRGPGGGGPGADAARHEGLLNWLDVKRALLMMKFAERSLEPERNAELEDWLCCQYFSSAHPLALCHTAELLYSLK
ncbi:inactive tyrosine-protein kinase PRAG1 isoform X2 [Phyllopteryx taeniolatus]|uniref:inactive tyrosine-protein kinase PRAG1 isoform X2 n=1 Tax=Phyllopteryx taeniolatus TaxID=161469 RepID=UPI002AD50EEB|nr:inactive tyrosine-protein kinase PRAG1 isoform X2 [Phyllopteryx taeniolatus]